VWIFFPAFFSFLNTFFPFPDSFFTALSVFEAIGPFEMIFLFFVGSWLDPRFFFLDVQLSAVSSR